MRIYTHPACTRHDPGPGHAERPLRLVAVTEALREAYPSLDWHEAPGASRGQLLRAHGDALLALILDTQLDGPMSLDPDTVLAPGSAEAALRAAGAGIAAVDTVIKGEEKRVFCAVRPPGHHATGDAAMGFCLFNNIAVAAAHACDKHNLARVAVIDFDVHHGNGTQAIFDTDPRVMYVSSHQMPLYPDTGYAHERGVGNIINAPLPAGTGSEGFRKVWREHLLPTVDSFRPQLVLISAGFDAHRRDPLAQVELDREDFAWITRELVAIAERHALGRVVSMLEGGYDLAALRESAVAHVGALME
ncbi:histone deacetylase family protein [Lysobacter antibioticus]|uniref:histone deacetylase family protein n=1 Tax=Lysobacter antibioticus TaxID=84531 RepID=UPI0004CFF999|nr:histone deacetylase family protein [Lysobacter antibioticus]